jgi:hypothetical protein
MPCLLGVGGCQRELLCWFLLALTSFAELSSFGEVKGP